MKRANSTALGLFVVIGLVLGIAGVLIFSSGTLFHPQARFILYFDSSLKGLNPGAPVKFRGVNIGKVEQILIHHNQASDDYSMPVIISIDKKVAQSKSDQDLPTGSQTHLNLLIQRGFRGRLDAESILTGVLYVSLDMFPDAPALPVFHQLRPEYNEIPTIPSQVQQLLANLEHFDLPGLSTKLNILLTRLDTNLSQFDLPRRSSEISNLLGAATQIFATPDMTNSVVALKRTLDRAERLLARIDAQVDPVADNLTNTLSEARKTLADLRQGIQNVSALVSPDSSPPSDLKQALEEIANTSRAIADLAEFLQRNPDALLTGRKRPNERP